MTYDEVKKLKITDIVLNSDLTKLTKQCLSIIDTSTIKDEEINMLINAAILDLERQGIDVEKNITDSFVQAAIIMFVKANFGMCDIKEKELAQKRYMQISNNLSLSSKYQQGVDIKNV